MSSYAKQRNIGNGWSETYKKVYQYILQVKFHMDPDDQAKVIYDQNILSSAKGLLLMPEGKWQSDAHNLKSSQVMCYNLFRPMMNDDGSLNDAGLMFVKSVLHIDVSNNARGIFEYEDQSSEWTMDRVGKATNFDFYIEDQDIRIFIEVKYTESSFGKATHKNESKYQFYHEKIKYVLGFETSRQELKDSYQLFRNTIRVSNNSYSVVLYPSANTKIEEEYATFIKKYNIPTTPYGSHAIRVYLEDCREYLHEDFVEKYLPFLD